MLTYADTQEAAASAEELAGTRPLFVAHPLLSVVRQVVFVLFFFFFFFVFWSWTFRLPTSSLSAYVALASRMRRNGVLAVAHA
jgi:hypothetical protein